MASASNIDVAATVGLRAMPVATPRAVRDGAQPGISQMVAANIARIPDGGDLDIKPVPAGFSQDLHDTLGDYGTEHDGWESLLSDMELSIGDDVAGLNAVFGILDEIGSTDFDAFSALAFDPISSATADFTKSGSALLDDFFNDASPPSNPPPPPPAPPPTGGGGGGGNGGGGNGGGGGGGGGGGCNEWVWTFDAKTGWGWHCAE